MRILLSKKSRLELLKILKEKNKAITLKDLAKSMNISFKTFNKWIYGKGYIPKKIIPPNFIDNLEILDEQADNWGQIKAGKIGGKKSIKILKKRIGEGMYREKMREGGKRAMKKLREKYGEKLQEILIKGKIRKREKQSRELEDINNRFFVNNTILLKPIKINYSINDVKREITFPKEVTRDLAEEIGIHLGDGCMSFNKNYFSVKTNKKEERYVTDFLFPLYKKLYNLNLKLMKLPSVSGFEVGSRALCEFKNKVLGLPYGEKINRILVPNIVLETKNKEIYQSFIRGLFDTDGCICVIKKNNRDYPVISITINSKELIKKVTEMLKLMGFIPNHNSKSIYLNGKVMLDKWIKEINSSNPVKIEKLKWASSIKDST